MGSTASRPWLKSIALRAYQVARRAKAPSARFSSSARGRGLSKNSICCALRPPERFSGIPSRMQRADVSWGKGSEGRRGAAIRTLRRRRSFPLLVAVGPHPFFALVLIYFSFSSLTATGH